MEFTVTELAVVEKLGTPREILYKDGPLFTGMFFNKDV